jgi:hypothetical protein
MFIVVIINFEINAFLVLAKALGRLIQTAVIGQKDKPLLYTC